ncbi:hexosaminidase D [Dendroctonus ponderosae]|uniref:hexosaminidase D n=1 Tax=Dendroctonus ponderosae TaxID=77166 RepID=UPI002035CC06|nr:hexosaminidase D [Dendroctonus ponderosae]KAH1013050.1 hypothetical protein HUJ05_012103 [Dendroctonus ponderosae]
MDQEKTNLDSYVHRIIILRRKKRMVLITLIIFVIIVVFGLQFYLVDQKGRLDMGFGEKKNVLLQSIGVKFIEVAKLNDQEHYAKDSAGMVQISQADRDKRLDRASVGDIAGSQTEKHIEACETDQQLGIPYVLLDQKKPFVPNHRIVHFDLKGAPPTISYLKKVISLAKNVGASGLLLEYEDMFPFSGNLAPLAAKNAYTLEQIKDILLYAQELKLEIIPLVQTFGHMEFALKLKEFAHIREVPGSPQSLCPSRNASLDLVRDLIHQILDVHTAIKYLHIGCDEVFEMGECEICRTELHEALFLKHIQNVASIVHDRNSQLQVIIWDDMLRHIPLPDLQAAKLGDQVEPMVWVYAEDIYRFVQASVWDKYASVFKTAWAASAFKGAFGETLYIPNARRHLENNLRWLDVMSTQSTAFKQGMRGIVLTGWQRYDHFAVLCEMLPAALPSLILNLMATSNGFFNVTHKEQFLSTLSCPRQTERRPSPFLNLDGDPNMSEKLARCLFPGHAFFKLMYRLHNVEEEAKEYIDTTTSQRGWMTAYNTKHKYSLPLRVDELVQDLPRVYHGMTNLARNAADALVGIMDNYTISEWIEQRIYPYIVELDKIQNSSFALKKVLYWPARPLPVLKELEKHGIALN